MNKNLRDLPAPQGLYDPAYEHDACGIGFVVNIKGQKSYDIIDDAFAHGVELNELTGYVLLANEQTGLFQIRMPEPTKEKTGKTEKK